jgi:hypothetical protein
MQQYGAIITDKNGWAPIFEGEDRTQFLTVNGYDAYTADSSGGAGSGGILKGGSPYESGNLSGFPWQYCEIVDPSAANPAWAGQPLLSAPVVSGYQKLSDHVILGWQDQALAEYYNVYNVTAGPTYTLIAQSDFPQYSLGSPTAKPSPPAVRWCRWKPRSAPT